MWHIIYHSRMCCVEKLCIHFDHTPPETVLEADKGVPFTVLENNLSVRRHSPSIIRLYQVQIIGMKKTGQVINENKNIKIAQKFYKTNDFAQVKIQYIILSFLLRNNK